LHGVIHQQSHITTKIIVIAKIPNTMVAKHDPLLKEFFMGLDFKGCTYSKILYHIETIHAID
jgi:hypothetical protein